MKLDIQQLKTITKGADRIVNEQNGTAFYRMPECVQNAFSEYREVFRERAKTTASVHLDFYTDAECIYVSYAGLTEGAEGVVDSFDLLFDERIVYTHRCMKSGSFNVRLEPGVRVRLFFPNTVYVRITEISLDGTVIKPCVPKLRLLCYGDSITQGYTAEHPSNSYVNRLVRNYDADVRNIGMGAGHFFKDAIAKMENFDPDIITVAYGTNDWNGDRLLFEPRCREFMQRLSKVYGNKRIIVLLPIWRVDWKEIKEKTGGFLQHRDFIKTEAERYGFEVCETIDFVPHDIKYLADGIIHPNDDGFEKYAEGIIGFIRRNAHA